MNTDQMERMRHGSGFIAALDQSGGSTPRALWGYGIGPDSWGNDAEMFDLVHAMRARVMTSPSFTSTDILAAILFERTMDSEVEGLPTADYLWDVKGIVPVLKVDRGLTSEVGGVRVMKPMPELDSLLAHAVDKHVFGTKMRSVIAAATHTGIEMVVDQQFEVAARILNAGLVPIIEPEVDIHAPDKEEAEALLHDSLLTHLDALPEGHDVIFKLTIPTVDGLYSDLLDHPRLVRCVALSGGYTRDEACTHLARNPGVIASFSRALLEGLTVHQSDAEFDATLAASIAQIHAASAT